VLAVRAHSQTPLNALATVEIDFELTDLAIKLIAARAGYVVAVRRKKASVPFAPLHGLMFVPWQGKDIHLPTTSGDPAGKKKTCYMISLLLLST
jgi:hypothetical protein